LRDAQAFFAAGSNRVVKTNALNEATIAANAFVSNNDIEKRSGFSAASGKSDDDHGLSLGAVFDSTMRHATWPPGQRSLKSLPL
jgi:hypothetical protein